MQRQVKTARKYGPAILSIYILCVVGLYSCATPLTSTPEAIVEKPPAPTAIPAAEILPVPTPIVPAPPTAEKLPAIAATATAEKLPAIQATMGADGLHPLAAFVSGIDMILIPKGEFLMGAAETDLYTGNDEKPQHYIYLSDYYIDPTEVTNSMYQACVEAGICTLPQEGTSYTRDNYYGNPDFNSYPVIHVDWNQARTYCEWRGARLPTEAEAEKAARGADGRIFPWGNFFESGLANFCDKNCPLDWADNDLDDGYADTSPVDSYPGGASPSGLLNMAGNVYEWVQYWYLDTYYLSPAYENPLGPSTGILHSVRGGSWSDGSNGLRVSYRSSNAPTDYSGSIGFRCAYSP